MANREKTFSEELPYFKERMKEISDNYDNPDGYADVLYLSALSDSNRIVRKAEEEIKPQQAENKRLEKEVNSVSIQFQDLQERYKESQAEIERFRKTEIEIDDFCRRLCRMRMLNGNAIASYEDLENYIQQEKSKAVKEYHIKAKTCLKANRDVKQRR